MKISAVIASVVLRAVSLATSGCAVFTKGRSQTVVVRSTPADAVAKINGVEVGRTPFKVKLSRSEVYRLDFAKSGFAPQSAVLLPSSEQYDRRFLKWGIDYDLGAAT
jgi:propanediol dehydratase large subunit